jgi:acetyl esterase/lipase
MVGMRVNKGAKRLIIAILAITASIAIIMGGMFLYSPALLVDSIDRIASSSNLKRIAEGVSFGPHDENKLDIYSDGSTKQNLKPVLVFFYGGGWANGKRGEYSYAARPFVENGYLVVVPDYRHVPKVVFPGFLEDSAAAVKWVQINAAKYGGDPDRVSVAGHSAGAYNALMLAIDPQWLGDNPVRGTISMAGPTDFYPFTSKRAIDAMSKAPDPLATQPISFVRKDAAPILLIHGTADNVVRVRNANSLFAKQSATGGDITRRRYEGASHNDLVLALSTLFRGRQPVVKDSIEFLNKHNLIVDRPVN